MEHPVARAAVVLLGASNLTRALATVVRLAQAAAPADCLIACGHGRSYGVASTVLGRTLPGILECGLWERLSGEPHVRVRALVTDVGNDLLYGSSPERIAQWVEACLARLAAVDARIVMTGLPLASLAALSPWRFALISRALFPMHRVRFDTARAGAVDLNDRLRELAARFGAAWIEPVAEWYGFDPIHIRRRVWGVAWKKILENWREDSAAPGDVASRRFVSAWRLLRLQPARRRLLGMELCVSQPSGALDNGSRVFLY